MADEEEEKQTVVDDFTNYDGTTGQRVIYWSDSTDRTDQRVEIDFKDVETGHTYADNILGNILSRDENLDTPGATIFKSVTRKLRDEEDLTVIVTADRIKTTETFAGAMDIAAIRVYNSKGQLVKHVYEVTADDMGPWQVTAFWEEEPNIERGRKRNILSSELPQPVDGGWKMVAEFEDVLADNIESMVKSTFGMPHPVSVSYERLDDDDE